MGVRVRGESLMVRGEDVHTVNRAIFSCVTPWHNRFTEKTMIKYEREKNKKYSHPIVIYL